MATKASTSPIAASPDGLTPTADPKADYVPTAASKASRGHATPTRGPMPHSGNSAALGASRSLPEAPAASAGASEAYVSTP